jgi:hypothetical protein
MTLYRSFLPAIYFFQIEEGKELVGNLECRKSFVMARGMEFVELICGKVRIN